MKTYPYILTMCLGMSVFAQAQLQQPPPPGGNYDPVIVSGDISPAPMLPAEFNGTAVFNITVGNDGDSTLVWVANQPLGFNISLANGVPDVADPNDPILALTALGGDAKNWFTWIYDPVNREFRGEQAVDIPGKTYAELTINYRATENTFFEQNFFNGFNANLEPPNYTGGQPTDNDELENMTFVRAYDYGDAPSSYGVPRHEVDLRKTAGLYNRLVYLGQHIDADDVPQHSSDATGDDNNPDNGLFGVVANDEDGVDFPAFMVPGETYNVPVSVTLHDYDLFENGYNGNIRLGFWIDWNDDGTFSGSLPERILPITGFDVINNVILPELDDEGEVGFSGARTFEFTVPITVPADQTPGNYFARVRVGPSTTPINQVAFGEVEDYMIVVADAPPPPGGSITGVVGVDTNGNGTPDTFESGVIIRLFDLDGNLVATTTTEPDGSYIFEDVPPGVYQIVKTPSSNFTPFSDIDGGNPNLIGVDADGVGSNVTVESGVENPGNNFLEILQACPDTWEAWVAKWESELPGQSGPLDNPDGDRYSNLIEYAFCLPPHSGVGKPFCINASISVAGAIDGVYTRTAIGGAKDVVYTLEWTEELANPTIWTGSRVLNDTELLIENDLEGKEIVTIPDLETFTGLTGGSGFVRIRVDLNDGTTVASATTDVVGWVETGFDLRITTYNNPFLECAVFTGTVSSIDGQDLLFATSTEAIPLDTLFEAGVAYYLEVETGPLAGNRFDLAAADDTKLTIASDSDSTSLEPPFNTVEGAAPAGLVGSRIAVHRAKTLNMLFPPSGFNASNDRTTSDDVQVAVGGVWRSYWLFDNAGTAQWVLAGDGSNADAGNIVIPPGRGMFFNNRSGAETGIIAFGEVREHAFANPLPVGNTVVGGGYPLDQAFTGDGSRELNLADGFFGSLDFKTADSVFRWRGDLTTSATGYDTYFLLTPSASPAKWVDQKDAFRAPKDADLIFERDRAVFQRVRDGVKGYGVLAPWSPDAVAP